VRRLRVTCVSLAALMAMAVAASPASAREDDAKNPVVLVAGSDHADPADCKALFGKLKARLQAMTVNVHEQPQRFTGGIETVGPLPADRNCNTTLEAGDSFVPMAKALAKHISDKYSSKGTVVDVVAQGTGGLLLRYALGKQGDSGWPELLVEDAVTVGTPHDGSARLAQGCPRREICQQMDKDAAGAGLFGELAGERFGAPQGKNGTDWSTIASAGDELVETDSANGMAAAQHTTTYRDDQLRHDAMLADDDDDRDAKIEYTHGGGSPVQWNKAPHVDVRIGYELIFGGSGKAGGAGCVGYNSEPDGPKQADPEGIAKWPGPADQLLSFVKSGVVEAYAACFHSPKRGEFVSDGVVRMNGLDYYPVAGQKITIDVDSRKISSGLAWIGLPSQWFGGTTVPLTLPHPVLFAISKNTGSEEERPFMKLGGDGKIFGLSPKGDAAVSFGEGSTSVEATLSFPRLPWQKEANDESPPLSLAGTLKTTNEDGLHIEQLGGKVEGDFEMGKMKISGGAEISFSLPDKRWKVDAKAAIPLGAANPEFSGGFDLITKTTDWSDWSLGGVRFGVDNADLPVYGPVYFQSVKVGIQLEPAFKLDLAVGLSLYKKLFSNDEGRWALVDFVGNLSYDDLAFSLGANMYVVGIDFASTKLTHTYLGNEWALHAQVGPDLKFIGGDSDDPDYEFSAKLQSEWDGVLNNDGADLTSATYACISGKIKVIVTAEIDYTCLNSTGRFTVNANAIAYSACAPIALSLYTGRIGFGLRWARQTRKFEYTFMRACDFGDWHAAAGGARAAGAGDGVRIEGSPAAEMVALKGDAAAPSVVLTGPGGRRVDASGQQPQDGDGIVRGDNYAVVASDANDTTYVVLAKPPAGQWKVEEKPGSAPVTAIRTADALPKPGVSAKLRHAHGGGWALDYRVRSVAGQKVSFVEDGRNVNRVIGVAHGRRGTIRFRPSFGPGGPRRIVADVVQDGLPRTKLTVARFHAPAPRLPGRPGKVRLRRRGERLTITWGPAKRANGYSVRVRMPDGRRLEFNRSAHQRRRVAVGGLFRAAGASVEVRALRRDGRAGPVRKAHGGKRRRG
jgi:hypothetical protein